MQAQQHNSSSANFMPNFDIDSLNATRSDREWMIEQVQAMQKVVAINEDRVRLRPHDTFLQAMLAHHKRTLIIFMEGVQDFVAAESEVRQQALSS